MRTAFFLLFLCAAAAHCPSSAALAVSPPGTPGTEAHFHTSPDGLTTAPCTCREATAAERRDLTISPDGMVQAEPRESYTRGTVPLPLIPDWVGTRVRAIGGLAWGDADNDGDQDLFVGTYYANQFPPVPDYYNFMYLNQGGAFSDPPQWISSDQRHTCDAKWGLINNDTYPDLFVANGGSSLHPCQVFYGQAGLLPTTAGWSSSTSNWTIDSSPCDFDKDGDLDMAVANEGNTTSPYRPTQLFRNNGNGLDPAPFWSSSQVGITNSVDWGDMDGDGWPDLAVAGWVNWSSGVYRNLHTTLQTTFAWTTGHPERTDKGIGWSDVDGDHLLDLLVGGNGDPDWLFHNEGTMLGAAPVWASGEAYTGCQELAWADVDGDGDEDLASVHFSTGHVRIYLNDGGVLPGIADWQYDDAVSATAIAFGDMNGDHMPDLAVGTANGPIKVLLNTGTPTGVMETAADLPRRGLRLTAGPNPFRERLVLSLESALPVTISRLQVFDVQGREVAGLGRGVHSSSEISGSAEAPPVTVRTSSFTWTPPRGSQLPAGVYLVRAAARTAEGVALSAACRIVRLPE